MVVQATGRVVRDRGGLELIVERRIHAPAAEVWKWLTDPAHLKKWIGHYRGTAVVGGDITIMMTFEDDATEQRARVIECEPGARFVLDGVAGDEPWHVAVALAEVDASTVIFLTQHVSGAKQAGVVGPYWEYYLDRLLAAHRGAAMPDRDDYFDPQGAHYERLATDGDPIAWTGR
jgi:uncharacterized protein YndB with AHSA1/START domain